MWGRQELFFSRPARVRRCRYRHFARRAGERTKWAQEKSLSVSWQRADLEKIELPESTYGLIVNFNYLQRSLVPQIEKSLKKGGHVIFETYLIDQQAVGHPKNPAYLLGHNELLDLFSGVRVLYYREGKFTEGDREAYRAGLFGQKITKELVHK